MTTHNGGGHRGSLEMIKSNPNIMFHRNQTVGT